MLKGDRKDLDVVFLHSQSYLHSTVSLMRLREEQRSRLCDSEEHLWLRFYQLAPQFLALSPVFSVVHQVSFILSNPSVSTGRVG